MAISLDLSKAFRHKAYGDLLCVLTWVNHERAMVLLPHARKSAWYIVMEPSVWQYDDPRYLAAQSKVMCNTLGLEPTPRNCVRVGEIVMSNLADLIRMPDEPEREMPAPAIGEARLYADGQLVHGEDVRADSGR